MAESLADDLYNCLSSKSDESKASVSDHGGAKKKGESYKGGRFPKATDNLSNTDVRSNHDAKHREKYVSQSGRPSQEASSTGAQESLADDLYSMLLNPNVERNRRHSSTEENVNQRERSFSQNRKRVLIEDPLSPGTHNVLSDSSVRRFQTNNCTNENVNQRNRSTFRRGSRFMRQESSNDRSSNSAKENANKRERSAPQSETQFLRQEETSARTQGSLADDLYNVLVNSNVPRTETNAFAKGNLNKRERSTSQSGKKNSGQRKPSGVIQESLADDLYSTLPNPKDQACHADADSRKRDMSNSRFNNQVFKNDREQFQQLEKEPKTQAPGNSKSGNTSKETMKHCSNVVNVDPKNKHSEYRNERRLADFRHQASDFDNSENEKWKRVKKRNKQRKVQTHENSEVSPFGSEKNKGPSMCDRNFNRTNIQRDSGDNGHRVTESTNNIMEVLHFNVTQNANEVRTRQHVLGYKELENLSEEDDPYEIIKVLANRTYGFEKLLKQQLRPDLLILTVKLLSKLCNVEFVDLKIQLLSSACNFDFLDQLSRHIAVIPLEQNKKRKANIESFFKDLMLFLETIVNLLPSKAAEESFEKIFMMTDITLKINEQQKLIMMNEEIKNKFEQINKQYKICVEEKNKIKNAGNIDAQNFDLAPDDFRDISLFPTSDDILSEEQAFIRPNIVEGAYSNVEHYLDVQFRLLREDFVSPLREGISQYIDMGENKHFRKINNVRIYRKVLFLNPKIVKDRLGLIVCFDPDKKLKKIVWEHTKRFMYGSLLLFSIDNFSSVIFATVMDRSIEELKKGRITVQLSEGTTISNELFLGEFVMAESNVYFEPYYHVMKALQEMKTSAFPMVNYIVLAEMSDNSPKYLTVEGGEILDIDGHPVSVLDDNSWPSCEKLNLDESQYNAFKACLTREFAVVQGPPGTGKTFLGLKIARVLLKNSPIWNASRKPILVVCYTNHALDQFLEGLVPVTDKIVRVGRQSKSKTLETFNLREKRKTANRQRGIFHLMRDIRFRMSDCMQVIKKVEVELEFISNHEGIISLSVLKELGISGQHLACFEAVTSELSDVYFIEWLEYGMYDDPSPNQVEENDVIQNPDENVAENEAEDEINPRAPGEDADDLQYQEWDDDLDLDVDIREIIPHMKLALDLKKEQADIEWVELQLQFLNEQRLEDPKLVQNIQEQERIRDDLRLRLNYFKYQLSREEYLDRRTLQQLLQHGDLWELEPNDRWHLYRYWVERLRTALIVELRRLEEKFHMEARMYEDAQQINDLEIMKNSLVVGMTTTGAARLQTLLNALRARIVIVEEAAEVFESHIVVSLTHHCEHLILIGDHKQLRPSPAVYKLAVNYKFDISLFERMLSNNMHCETLKVQHRMRPEIVQLIVPTIYPELKNHSSVLQFERIKGTLKSLYFITHNHPEEEVDDISSHKNTHEGDFLMELCRYLVLQGYDPSRITVLATYSGQMFYLRTVRKRYTLLSDVRIAVIDNFQGEENDIILLSMVRSNKEARIGFLKTENRVCVALSRARMGLFIIGNMDNLLKGNTIWPKVRDTLKQQDAIGTHLTLRCQVHPAEFTRVCSAADFSSVPEGGCKRLCDAALICGHNCKSVCHVRNREHEDYRCYERCERIPDRCDLNHRCLRMCWENCGDCQTPVKRTLPCGHMVDLECGINPAAYNCREIVEVELPICGHKVQKPCYRNVETFQCSYPCENRLPCGHTCNLKCHTRDDPDHLEYVCTKPCARKNAGCKENHLCNKLCYEDCGDCSVRVERDLPACGHKGRMRCSQDPEVYRCYKKCQKKLECGHDCPNTCSVPCGNCPVKVTKLIEECGHSIQVRCSEVPHRSNCMQRCKSILQCGHTCRTVCSADCTTKCYVEVESKIRPACGHVVLIPCFMQNEKLLPLSEKLLSHCQMPCDKLLDCQHRCQGTCGECRQGRIHKTCKEKCGRVLICGHSCNIPCAENCPPCERKCLFKCKHSKCPRKCGQPCVQCKEPCGWACIHKKCTKFCYDLCDREPCNEPCNKLLACKHPCIGFCGETCPPLCRICNEDEVTEIFFGNEDEPNARFVLLEDCKHTLEATGLEQWMSESDNEIKLKSCPKCKTPVTKTQRYMNIVKKVYQDICRVKRRIFGELRVIEANRDELTARLIALGEHEEFMEGSKEYKSLYTKLLCELKPVMRSRANMLSSLDTGTLRVQIEIFSQLVENYYKVYKVLDDESKIEILNYLDILLQVVRKRERKISNQEVNDINMEIQRFYRLCQLYKLCSEPSFKTNRDNSKVMTSFEAAFKIGYTIGRFTKDQDNAMKNALEAFAKEIKSVQGITDAERKEIVRAMNFSQGHWYKCPNGHIYLITECGGAMEVGRCNECGAEIGGTHHRLLSSNRLASEMDGATHPAWPQ